MRGRRYRVMAVAAALLLTPAARAGAAPDTTIGFDDLDDGTAIANQYAGQGVSFGSGQFGATGLDCGDPVVQEGTDPGPHSPPSFARLAFCASGRKGVTGGFDATRTRVSFFVRVVDGLSEPVTLRGYDAAQDEILHQSITADQTWQQVSIAQPAGQAPAIRYFSVISDSPTTNEVGVDDMGFDNPTPIVRFVSRTPHALANQVVALDGSPSRSSSAIDRYSWDFDGDGRFDAVCPGALPVAYKQFGKAAAYDAFLKIQDLDGHHGTFHDTIAIGNHVGSHAVKGPRDLAHFWCGTRAGARKTDLGFLRPGFTTDVHAVGIDVTQGIVPSGFGPGGRFGIRFRSVRSIESGNYEEDPASYRIAYLQRLGKTVVRVYASAIRAPNGTDVPNVQMRLYGVDSHGASLPGSPLLSETGPLTVPVGPPIATHAMRAGLDASGNPQPAFTFTLPDDWARTGEIGLLAKPVLVGRRLDRQCLTLECGLAQQRALGGVRFFNTGLFIIRSVKMDYSGSPALPDPFTAFDAIANVTPIALLASPYQATRDLTQLRKDCRKPDGSFCDDINDKVKADIDQWTADNKPLIPSQAKVITVGVHRGFGEAQGSSSWPSTCDENKSGGAICETSDQSPVSHVELDRPLTSVGHEVLHDLGRPHAGADCGGNGPSWPPDDRGDLHGIGLDRHPGSGGSLTQPYRLISPEQPGQPGEQYDLMSYCYGGKSGGGTDCFETCAWISPENWNELAREWVDFLGRPKVLRGLVAAATRPTLAISAYVDASGVHVAHVGTATGVASHATASAFHAVVRDGAGHVISDTPLRATFGHSDDQRGNGSTPYVALSGVVPSSSAAGRLELTENGSVAASATRSAHPPKVKLLSPLRGRIGSGSKVAIRWRASDADRDPLVTYVDYSADAGRHWRTVFSGGNGATVKLPRAYFSFSRDARVRVRVNDGFDERAALSGRLRSPGSRPVVRISSPRRGLRVTDDASVYLAGQAFDDGFAPLTGGRLSWFVGRRLVGHGIAATAARIPPGSRRIRLVARDRHGRRGTASVRIRSVAVRPFFVVLDAPARLSPHKSTLRLRVATDQGAGLTVGDRSFHVGPRTRTLRVHVGRGRRTLNVKLVLSAHGKTATQTLRVRRGG